MTFTRFLWESVLVSSLADRNPPHSSAVAGKENIGRNVGPGKLFLSRKQGN
jgi:hypothetical protein